MRIRHQEWALQIMALQIPTKALKQPWGNHRFFHIKICVITFILLEDVAF